MDPNFRILILKGNGDRRKIAPPNHGGHLGPLPTVCSHSLAFFSASSLLKPSTCLQYFFNFFNCFSGSVTFLSQKAINNLLLPPHKGGNFYYNKSIIKFQARAAASPSSSVSLIVVCLYVLFWRPIGEKCPLSWTVSILYPGKGNAALLFE